MIEPLAARLPLVARPEGTSLRGLLATAFAVVIAEPGLWVLGMAGFLLRGGWLVLVLCIWTMPSPVAVTTIVGPDAIGTGGLSPGLTGLIAASLATTAVVLLLSAIGAAWVEVVAFEHFVHDPETETLRGGRRPRELTARARRGLIGRLVLVYAASLVPAFVALLIAVIAIASATYQDFLLPGELSVPLAVRVAGASAGPLALLALCVVVGELLASVFTRQTLADRYRLTAGGERTEPSAHGAPAPRSELLASALRVAGLCWSVTLVLVIPGIAATLLGWSAVRAAFLGSAAFRGLDAAVAAGGVTILFVGLWLAAFVLAGVSGALRSGLWSGWWLRESRLAPVTNASVSSSRSDAPAGSP